MSKRTASRVQDSETKTKLNSGSATEDMELEFWNSVKNSNDPAMIDAYIKQFPSGTFVSLAKIKLKKLRR